MARQRVSLAPLMGVNSTRVSDRALNGTFMRGGYNVELRGGEWWSRQGEQVTTSVRFASTPWWWVQDINSDLTIAANPWWAVASNGEPLYAAAITESVTFTNGSATATSSTTRVQDQLITVAADPAQMYRAAAIAGTTLTLERPFEGTSGAKSCNFHDPLARNSAGAAVSWTTLRSQNLFGSAVVFEQLVSHTATALHAASPATTAGRIYLIITSNFSVPVAIDLTAYIAGSPVAPLRTWFYNTALAAPTLIGASAATSVLSGFGTIAEVYKGRLFIGPAADPNGSYGARTVWWSQVGDFLQWHTGIAGQTAAPNFKTFDGENNDVVDLKPMRDEMVVHRYVSQETCAATNSLAAPFSFRANIQGFGVGDLTYNSNRVIVANNVQYIWTGDGPAVFDGAVRLIAVEAHDALAALHMIRHPESVSHALHDTVNRRIYWFSVNATRQQSIAPTTAVVTNTANIAYNNNLTVFVYDYVNDTFWFEDRPMSIGGGMSSRGEATYGPVLQASRLDGTMVKLTSSTPQVGDASHLTPTTSGDNVAVNWRVTTPWLSLGSAEMKQLQRLEVIARAPGTGEHRFDRFSDVGSGASGTSWLRCQVYCDMNELTARADVGVAYDPSSSQADSQGGFYQAAPLLLEYTPRAHGREFKLVFSNVLTSAASAATYKQHPVRISDIQCEFEQMQSTQARTNLNAASISE